MPKGKAVEKKTKQSHELKDFKVYLYKDYSVGGAIRLVISAISRYDEVDQYGLRVEYVSLPLEFEPQKHGECSNRGHSTLFLDRNESGTFVNELQNAISSLNGITTDNEFKIQGTLEATRDHLKDMQKLVFKEVNNEK